MSLFFGIILLGTIVSAFFTALIGLLIATILGFIIGWILRYSKIGYWKGLFENKTTEYDSLQSNYGLLETDRNDWRSKYNLHDQKIGVLNSDIQERDNTIIEYKDYYSKWTSLQSDYDTKVNEYSSLYKSKEKVDTDLANTNDALLTANNSISDWKKKFDDLTKTHKNCQTEISTLKSNLTEKETAWNNLNGQVSTLNTRITDLEPWEGKYNNLLSESEGLKSKVTELEPWQTKYNSLDTDYNSYKTNTASEIEGLKSDIGNLNSKIDSYQTQVGEWQSKYDAAVLKSDGAISQQAELSNQINALKADSEKLNTLQSDYNGLSQKWEALQKQSNEKDDQLSGLKSRLSDAEANYNNQLQSWKVKFEESEQKAGKADSLKADFDKVNAELNALNSSNSALKERAEIANNQIMAEQEKVSQFQKQLSDKDIELEKSKAELTASEEKSAQVGNLKFALEDANKKNDSLNAQIKELNEKANSINGLKQTITTLEQGRDRLVIIEKEHVNLKNRLAQIEPQNQEISNRLRATEEKLLTATNNYKELNAENEDLQKSYQALKNAPPKEVEVIKEVEKIVEKPVEVIKEVEKIVEKPIEVIKEIEKIVEKPIEVIKEVEVIKTVEKIIEKPIEVIKKVVDEKAIADWKAKLAAANNSINSLQADLTKKPKTVVKEIIKTVEKKVTDDKAIANWKAKLAAANDDIKKLRADLAKKPKTIIKEIATKVKPAKKESKDAVLARIKSKAKLIDFKRIGKATSKEKNDLQLISGVGPFSEKKMNALGIYSFKQIANFNAADMDKVNDAIEFFPGRVKRDDWVGQAKKLLKGGGAIKKKSSTKKVTSKKSVKKKSTSKGKSSIKLDFNRIGKATSKNKQDLTKITGIGKDVAAEMNKLGIYTYEQIANLNKADQAAINDYIPFFPNKLREDWVVQAKKKVTSERKAAEKNMTKDQKEAAALKRVQAKAKALDFKRIGKGSKKDRDDLQRIKGIGPFIEKKLNALGIFRFFQIGNFTAADTEMVNDAIEFFPGRAKRDKWVAQAKKLAKAKK